MGVSGSIYTGPMVILTISSSTSEVEIRACQKCGKEPPWDSKAKFCEHCGGAIKPKKISVVVKADEWWDSQDGYSKWESQLTTVNGGCHQIPDDEIWLIRNTDADDHFTMGDPCRDGTEIFCWEDQTPDTMMAEFQSNPKINKILSEMEGLGAQIRVVFVTLTECS